MEVISRKQVKSLRKHARYNAKLRTTNAKSIELKQSRNDASKAIKSFGNSVKELLNAVIAVVKFIARDIWADFGKLIQFVAQKMNRAGNHMDWSDK